MEWTTRSTDFEEFDQDGSLTEFRFSDIETHRKVNDLTGEEDYWRHMPTVSSETRHSPEIACHHIPY